MECRSGRVGERHPRGGSAQEPSHAANSSNQDGERSDCEEELASQFQDGPETQKGRGSDAKGISSSTVPAKLAEEPPRLNFQIPRRNKEKRALFQYLSSDSRECAEILKIITSSYKDPSSTGNFVYSKPRLVHSEPLEKDFIEKRKELKQEGRTEKELTESFCFVLCDTQKVPLVCERGLSVGSSWMNILGNPSKGVYLCQFSDLLQISPYDPGSTGEMIVFKVIKGKVKSIHDNMSRCLDPTPKFDSHFSKNANRVTSLQSYRAFEYTQQYFYEYVDYELTSRPRHVCPYAVVCFQFKAKEVTAVGSKPLLPLQRSNSLPLGTEKRSYIVWRGQFFNAGKEVYQTSLRSLLQPFLPFRLPDRLEIGKVMRLDQIKGLIPSSLFSWDLYSGSHEVFKKGLHCSLFEVVEEKNKSGESLAELFQKLEDEGLVLVNSLSDNGFLFLLSSEQMSNTSERRAGWKKSCLQALFIYRGARDVSKFSCRPHSTCQPLMPLPQDPAMPRLGCFIPAFHYALNKVRANPPAILSAGVEQQAYDYLSSLREGKLVQRARLDYDHKLDEREKLFPAPRQKYNWESYVRSYFYAPGMFTMPVEKAKNMVDLLWCPPEACMEIQDGNEAPADPERLKELLKLIQMNKNLKVAKQEKKGLEEGALDAHGVKRKLEEEEHEISPKFQKMASLDSGEIGGEVKELQSCPFPVDMLCCAGLQDTDLRKDKAQGALKVVQLLDRLSKTTQDTDLRKDRTQGAMVMKMLENLDKTLPGSSVVGAERQELGESGEDTAALYDSMTRLGLPTNCDIDLRNQFVDDDQEAQGKNDLERKTGRDVGNRAQVQAGKDETAGSLSSLEAFSPCSDTNGQQRGVNLLGEKSIPWVLIPITGLKTERYSHRKDESLEDPRFLQSPVVSTRSSLEKKDLVCSDLPDCNDVRAEHELEPMDDRDTNLTDELKFSHSQEQKGTPLSGVDCIVDKQISEFSSEVEDLLREERVYYIPFSSSHGNRNPPQTMAQFSEYVSHFNMPLPVHSYINSFRDSIRVFLDPQQSRNGGTACAFSALPSPTHSSVSPSALEALPSDVPLSVSPLVSTPLCSPVAAFASNPLTGGLPAGTHGLLPPPNPTYGRPEQAGQPRPDVCNEVPPPPLLDMQKTGRQSQAEQSVLVPERQESGAPCRSSPGEPLDSSTAGPAEEIQSRLGLDVGESVSSARPASAGTPEEPASNAINSLLSQLQPEVFSNLVKIIEGVQKNTVHFYIHSVEEESDTCWEIKEYLKKLGNSECDPQTFLENKDSQDKLLIIIQNVDIAAHVHKIPALVSLKKLPSVSFAGVDSLDDIKNHTYNELFVSGGFIVSDEFVLNPDFITQDKLQALLQYLEELNTPESPWRWRVHCKTHKKVKEQSRSSSEALSVLNLLTMYHKKQIVEFLSYHECDAQSHQAPDLDCLVKLQAQNIRQRHVIFLTERRFEMFPHYSSSGVVIANIDDVLYNMASLIGEASDKHHSSDLPSCPASPTLREEDMDSDIEHSARRESTLQDRTTACTDPSLGADPHPCVSHHTVEDKVSTNEAQKALDFEALKAAISQFRVARMQANSTPGQLSPRALPINPHQSLLNQGDMAPTQPQSSSNDGSLSSLSASSFLPHAHLHLDQMQKEHHFILESATEAQAHGAGAGPGQVEMGSTAECATVSLDGPQVEICPKTNDVLQLSVHGMVEPATHVLSAGVSFAAATDTQPTWNRTTKTDISTETPASPAVCRTEGDCGQDKPALEMATTNNPVLTTSSTNDQSKDSTVSTANGKHNSRAGLLPVPGTVAYGMNNALAGVDRMVLPGSSLWPTPQRPMGLNSHGHLSQNGAIGVRSQILNRSMTSSLGMVTQSGLRGLFPNSSMQVAWNGLAQGTSNVWGIQQGMGIRQVHRTQFIQSYTWQGNPSFQGNGYPHRRGGYGGW
ncbi:protein TASOR [Electrophorus electricus]|uniref:protein TASOR n=1 Tax=Electrophorus electricus TaxID=8005 RepID=UPI0015CFF40B|nr:protein TASOR [Electrophorus electricus]